MSQKIVELFQEQKVQLDFIQELLYHTISSHLDLDEPQVRQELERILKENLDHNRGVLAQILNEQSTDELLLGTLAKNRSLMSYAIELQLRILSHQTGRSVMDLRNEILRDSEEN